MTRTHGDHDAMAYDGPNSDIAHLCQICGSSMPFAMDLDDITAGYGADHFLDDEEFNYAVHQMEELGHSAEAAAAALREWIAHTPMWDCPECGRTMDESSYAECPLCEVANPNVAFVQSGE